MTKRMGEFQTIRYAVDLVEITTWRLGASGLWGVGETDHPNSIFSKPSKPRKGEWCLPTLGLGMRV